MIFACEKVIGVDIFAPRQFAVYYRKHNYFWLEADYAIKAFDETT